jgi:hypothetical protein
MKKKTKKKAAKKIVTKDSGYGIGIPYSTTNSPTGEPSTVATTVSTPNAQQGAMYWPAASQWYSQGKEATKKIIIDYVNAANQLQAETDQERKLELIGKLNTVAQSVIQGIAIATEAAEAQVQRKRSGDQAAQFELAVTEDSLNRLLKILWVHNLVAKKGIYPGLEIKAIESQLTGRINRTTTMNTADIGVPIKLEEGEDPNALWMTDYTPTDMSMMSGPEGVSQTPVAEGDVAGGPEVPPVPDSQEPGAETEGEVPPETGDQDLEQLMEMMQQPATEEAPMETAIPDEGLRQREVEVAQREAAVAQREASVAQREAAANGTAPQEEAPEEEYEEEAPEEEYEEEPEGEEIPEEEVSEEEIDEEAPEEEEEPEEISDEMASEEEPEEEPEEELRYCIYCDQEVTPEEIEACQEEKCPFKSQAPEEAEETEEEEPEEEEETYKHFVLLDHGDHDNHNVVNLTFKEYTGIDGAFCTTCQKLVSCEFDSDSWDSDQIKTWVKKQMKKREIVEKSPVQLVQEVLDEIPDDELVEWIEHKKNEGIYGKGLGFLADLTEDDIKPMVEKGFEAASEAVRPLIEQLDQIGPSSP